MNQLRQPDRLLAILHAHVEAVHAGNVDPSAVFRAIEARVPKVTFDELYDAARFAKALANDLTMAWRWSGTREGRREFPSTAVPVVDTAKNRDQPPERRRQEPERRARLRRLKRTRGGHGSTSDIDPVDARSPLSTSACMGR